MFDINDTNVYIVTMSETSTHKTRGNKMATEAKRFETEEQAKHFLQVNDISYAPHYESGHYESVTGMGKGWYLVCAGKNYQEWVN